MKKYIVIILAILILPLNSYCENEKYINVFNEKIFVRISGEGSKTPIVLIHGIGMSSKFWQNNINELSVERKVYAFDLPGFGNSDIKKKEYSLNYYINILDEFLNTLKISKVILVGHSIGGIISILYTNKNPEKVEKLVLVDSDGGEGNKDFFKLIKIPIIGDIYFTMRDKEMIKKSLKNDFFYNPNYVSEDLISEVNHGKRDVFLSFIRNSTIIINELPKIKCPTLIIWGEKDHFNRINNAHIFNEKITNSNLLIISDSGTCPQIEKSEIFNKTVNEFILPHSE